MIGYELAGEQRPVRAPADGHDAGLLSGDDILPWRSCLSAISGDKQDDHGE